MNDVDSNAVTALSKRNTSRTLITISFQVAAIILAATICESVDEIWVTCLASIFIGTRQYGLGEVLVHEASHRNLSNNREFNDMLGILLSWPFFFTFEGYRRFHVEHHRLPLDDPENTIFEQYEDWRLPLTGELSTLSTLWFTFLRPITGVTALLHLWGVISDAYWDSDLKENTLMWGSWLIAVGVAWQFGLLTKLIIYWLLPLFFVFATLNYWSEIADHYRTSDLQTRSYTGRWWNSLVGGNIGYHAVHHKYPGIPWFRLRQAHLLLGEHLIGQTSRGPVEAFRQIRDGYQLVGKCSWRGDVERGVS